MPRKSFTTEQIISKLREAEVLLGQGQTVGDIYRLFNIIEQTYYRQTYYRWRKKYGGIRTDQVRRLKELEKENAMTMAPSACSAACRRPRGQESGGPSSTSSRVIRPVLACLLT